MLEGFISELSSVSLVNTDGGGLTGLYHCRDTNYCHASRLYHVLFSDQTGTLRQATSGSGSLILLVVSQQTSRRLLRAFRMP